MICLGCRSRVRAIRHYLCSACWLSLTHETRRRLGLRDAHARLRLMQLWRAVRSGVALAEIAVRE